MWGPAISGMGKSAYLRKPKLQAYPPIFSLTPKASGSTWLQSCEDIIHETLKPVYGDNIDPEDLVAEGGVVDSEETIEDADKEDAADTDEASDDTKDAETTEEPEETEAAEDAE